jgi:hypothetical protein
MALQAGDRVVAESESTERPARYGTVREVVHEDPHARYRIEWDDGRTSVYTPAAGALRRGDARQVDRTPSPGQRPGLADQRSRRRLALAPGARSRARCAATGTARFAGTRPGPAVHAPAAPLFATADECDVWLTRFGPSRRAPSLIEPACASGLAQRPRRRGPAGRRVARRRLPASPREPPAFRRGDRVVRRFAHALRLRGALASRARPPCWRAPAPCGRALGRPTGRSGSP